QIAISPCGTATPKPDDPGVMARLDYLAYLIQGKSGHAVRFSIFETKSRPITFDLGGGTWQESRDGEAHLLSWSNTRYRDPEKIDWNGDTNVLVVERGDYTLQLVSSQASGLTDDLLR